MRLDSRQLTCSGRKQKGIILALLKFSALTTGSPCFHSRMPQSCGSRIEQQWGNWMTMVVTVATPLEVEMDWFRKVTRNCLLKHSAKKQALLKTKYGSTHLTTASYTGSDKLSSSVGRQQYCRCVHAESHKRSYKISYF